MPVFEQLFEKYIKGDITPAEEQQLFGMIAQPEYNARLLQLIDQTAARSGGSHEMAQEKAEEILSLVINARPGKVKRLNIWRYAAAAAVVLAVSGLTWSLMQRQATAPALVQHQRKTSIDNNDIAPAVKGALLTLADGSTVPLDSIKQGLIANQSGASVSLQNGTVSYNGDVAEVSYNTLSTPKGKLFHLVLPDGSEVWLNAGSAITYPTGFTGKERSVTLKGEAYFEIAQNASQPFMVKVGGSEVKVLGTRFNINAYDNEVFVRTTLLQGSVSVSTGHRSRILQPGQQSTVSGVDVQVQTVDVSQVMAWKNGLFNFENAGVKDVMNQLERWYDIEVQYENGVPDITFGGKMERGLSLSHVMRILEISKVKLRLEGRTLIVSR
ncbi:FecR family protein [uncultured Chitinophaga sp.]|uniref:FecR family protein n=1 Tax=uncultured Chitinophaga sp. TaxID=339340 RepID=UPI0025F1392F|nr:FecR family protein [uncultured Chitinophaga sp.]